MRSVLNSKVQWHDKREIMTLKKSSRVIQSFNIDRKIYLFTCHYYNTHKNMNLHEYLHSSSHPLGNGDKQNVVPSNQLEL